MRNGVREILQQQRGSNHLTTIMLNLHCVPTATGDRMPSVNYTIYNTLFTLLRIIIAHEITAHDITDMYTYYSMSLPVEIVCVIGHEIFKAALGQVLVQLVIQYSYITFHTFLFINYITFHKFRYQVTTIA